jgi:hypothetical protein
MIETDYSFSRLPEITELRGILSRQPKISFKVPSGSYGNTFLKSLHDAFPEYSVFYIDYLHTITIRPAIATSLVLKNIDGFLSCFKAFDEKACEMMQLMSDTFGISLSKSEMRYTRSEDGKLRTFGNINDEWEYRFHGQGCSFKSNKTGQFLDVQVVYAPEFGVIDTFYMLKFINSTDSLKEWKLLLDDSTENMEKVINVLFYENGLTEVQHDYRKLLILNREPLFPTNL